MNTQIINAELALALRKCLPFVRRHAIISGGDGALTYTFAVRALADADARQQEEQRVKNIVEAEANRRKPMTATEVLGRQWPSLAIFADALRPGAKIVGIDRGQPGGDKTVFAALDSDGYLHTQEYYDRNRNRPLPSGQEALNQAARAVRPGEGYLPAAPPAKGCNCDICTEARLRGLRRAGL